MPPVPRNCILLDLIKQDRNRVLSHCEREPLPAGRLLVEVGARLDKIYFPESGVISTIAMFRDGGMIELAVTGREGCTGLVPLLGGRKALAGLLVQLEGEALTLSLADFLRLVRSVHGFEASVKTYARRFLHQMLVSGACNGLHRVDQRLARWLLSMRDRSDDDIMPLTQDFLASMLGVRRPSVTAAAQALQSAGCISYARGRIAIADRGRLERASCECYHLVRDHYRAR